MDILTLIQQYGTYAVVTIIFFDRLAKLTPTEWDNRTMSIVTGTLYRVFAILGLKFPDIEKIELPKITPASK